MLGEAWRKRARGGRRRRFERLLLALFVFAHPAQAWTIGGRFGLEVDGIDERFRSSSLFDERVVTNEGIEETLDSDPIVSKSTTTSVMLETRVESGGAGAGYIRLSDVARLSPNRARSNFKGEVGYRGKLNRIAVETQWNAQGGRDEPAAGSSAFLTATWSRKALPLGFGSQLRLAADWSHTDEEDLAPILETRTFRGQAEVTRKIAPELDLGLIAGVRHKDALGSSIGSYNAWFMETEGSGRVARDDRVTVLLRSEERTYAADTLGIPSSRLTEGTLRYEGRLGSLLHPYIQNEMEWQDYEEESDIFQDQHGWTGEVGTDLFWSAIWGGRTPDSGILVPDLRLRIGGRYEILRSGGTSPDSLIFDSTFDSFGGRLGVSREGGERLWFDIEMEAGRREYRNGPASGTLVFEGLNFSLASSDYTYLRSSLVLDWLATPWIKAEAFLQWDQELHDVSGDDFRLWMLNVSVSHPF